MAISVFDLFKIGIGPSSSHTVGPMRAARGFALALEQAGVLPRVHALKVELFGSLGATGRGHGTDKALFLGLEGDTPDGVEIDSIEPRQARMRAESRLNVLGKRAIAWSDKKDITFHRNKSLPIHPNGMRFLATDEAGAELLAGEYYSIGGGFVVDAATASQDKLETGAVTLAHPFRSAEDLLRIGKEKGLRLSQLMLENERAWRTDEETRKGVVRIWKAMEACVARGCRQEGTLPGGLAVRRRAPTMIKEMLARPEAQLKDPLTIMDWVNIYVGSPGTELEFAL